MAQPKLAARRGDVRESSRTVQQVLLLEKACPHTHPHPQQTLSQPMRLPPSHVPRRSFFDAADLTEDSVEKRYCVLSAFQFISMHFVFTRASTLAHRMEVETSIGGEEALVTAINSYSYEVDSPVHKMFGVKMDAFRGPGNTTTTAARTAATRTATARTAAAAATTTTPTTASTMATTRGESHYHLAAAIWCSANLPHLAHQVPGRVSGARAESITTIRSGGRRGFLRSFRHLLLPWRDGGVRSRRGRRFGRRGTGRRRATRWIRSVLG